MNITTATLTAFIYLRVSTPSQQVTGQLEIIH